MNFIGHATVALWHGREPRFVLGSMLPDFANMAGTRVARELDRDPALAAGVALHHRTDEIFHAAPLFTALLQELLDGLCARGVPRGSARAVGHIGVEMLIDGELLRGPEIAHAYLDALQDGADLEYAFVDAPGGARWQRLREALLAHGAPHDYREPEAVLRRLTHVLRSRPRLAIAPEAAQIIRETLPDAQQRVVATLPALLTGVRAALF